MTQAAQPDLSLLREWDKTGDLESHNLSRPFISPQLIYQPYRRPSDGEILIALDGILSVETRFGRIDVPVSFLSDGASIPRWARRIVGSPFDLEYLAAAIIHDLLYRKGNPYGLTRAQADLVFRDLLWNTKVPRWKIPAFYAAVRAGGWSSYQKHS